MLFFYKNHWFRQYYILGKINSYKSKENNYCSIIEITVTFSHITHVNQLSNISKTSLTIMKRPWLFTLCYLCIWFYSFLILLNFVLCVFFSCLSGPLDLEKSLRLRFEVQIYENTYAKWQIVNYQQGIKR